VDVHDVASQQKHLSGTKQSKREQILLKYPKFFSRKLGCYLHRKVHLDLKQDATPCHFHPYPVPRHHEQVFKEELDRLCEIGVQSRCGASQWLSPLIIIPKKDGRVHWISDFRKHDKQIMRKVYHLPKIQDILTRTSGNTYFTNWIYPCNTIPSNWMNPVKKCVQCVCLSATIGTIVYHGHLTGSRHFTRNNGRSVS
jgi:hypothetical protein